MLFIINDFSGAMVKYPQSGKLNLIDERIDIERAKNIINANLKKQLIVCKTVSNEILEKLGLNEDIVSFANEFFFIHRMKSGDMVLCMPTDGALDPYSITLL